MRKFKERKARTLREKASGVMRREIAGVFSPLRFGGGRSALDNMKKDADSYNCGDDHRRFYNNAQKASGLVAGGWFSVYPEDQKVALGKIYGKKNVAKWGQEKTWNTYSALLGREYEAMLREKSRGGKEKGKNG